MERNQTEALRVFHEVRGVEQALIQLLVTAIDNKYLIAFKNRTTGQFNGTLMQIIQYLRSTYRKISPAQLITYEAEVTNMTYDPTTPVDLVVDKIDNLLMYGDFANCPFTATQAITKGYHILNNCGNIYNDYLPPWNRIHDNQKTWDHFKTHFLQVYNELEATNALNTGDLGYQHYEGSSGSHFLGAITAQQSRVRLCPCSIWSDLIQELLDKSKELICCLTENKHQVNHSPRRNIPKPKQGQPTIPLPPHYNKYCWTHGRCNHNGSEYRNKAPIHKVDAGMSDKMGGSTYACPSDWRCGSVVRLYKVNNVLHSYTSTTLDPPKPHSSVTLKADSGASSTYLREIDQHTSH